MTENNIKREIIKTGKERSAKNRYSEYAIVKFTIANESLEFICRNIPDFGYTINPKYKVAEGVEGGLRKGDYWQDFKPGKGWFNVRKLTEFEKLALDDLKARPPIDDEIDMY